MQKILIIGGAGDGIAVSEFIEESSEYTVLGYLNDFEAKGTLIGHFEVVGTSEDWKKFSDCFFVFSLHRFCKMHERYEKLKKLQIPAEKFPNIIHPKAFVSKSCKLNGFGTVVYPFASIQNNAVISSFCSVRSGANIGHDCTVGEFCYVGPNAVLSGYAQTEKGVYIAPNATINSSVILKKFAMAGSGSVIYKDIDEYQIYQGNPARYIGKTNEQNI